MPALDEIEHLVGMQAQAPRAPYVALWSRLSGFAPAEFEALVEERHVVRAAGMLRTTIHLVSAADALAMRPVLQRSIVERGFRSGSPFAHNLVGLPIEDLLAVGRELLAERPRSTAEMGRLLGERWPDRDPVSLAKAVRYLVPLVQVPPRGLWNRSAPPRFATMEDWFRRPLAVETAPDAFVPEYDNVLLSHRDRTRIIESLQKLPLPAGDGGRMGTFLLDGFTAATWRVDRVGGRAMLAIAPWAPIGQADRSAVEAEAAGLLGFVAPDDDHDVGWERAA